MRLARPARGRDSRFGEPEKQEHGLRIGPGAHIDVDEPREIKVKLPLDIHLKLHALKITGQRSISEIVLEALEAYLHRMAELRDKT